MPRGVLAVVAVGLLACVVAAVLTTGKGDGEAANLEWVQTAPMPDSKPVDVPGGKGTVDTAQGTEIAQTKGGLRATYPRSSEGIYTQEVPGTILVNFSSHSSELAVLEVEDLPDRFSTERGVKLEWPKYEVGTEHLEYFLPAGRPVQDLELPFYTVWRTTAVPAATVSCTLTTGTGRATVRTRGALKKISPPINEDEEAEKEEEQEEAEEE